MCGRIELSVIKGEQLEEHYHAKLVEEKGMQKLYVPRYNVPPSSYTPIVAMENPEEIVIAHWGYVPTWHKAGVKERLVNNARSETVLEKPFFKSSALGRRCLIPVTGFFEWKTEEKSKTPFHFHMNGKIFSLGGLYTNTKNEEGLDLSNFAILTTEANALMAPVHDRIPVIISQEEEELWLSDIDENEIGRLMRSYDIPELTKTEVSKLVNNPRHDTPEVIKSMI